MVQTPAMPMALSAKLLSPFPDILIHKILQLLPTKVSVGMSFLSKQHQGVWSLLPFIDFVECRESHDDDEDDANCLRKHRKFINILKGYLEYREEQAKLKNDDAAFQKLSIRMLSYLCGEDDNIVDKWLAFSFRNSAKKLRISLGIDKQDQICDQDRIKLYHCLSGAAFANARSITTLNLESVRMKNIDDNSTKLLPCLKALSMKNVHFDEKALFSLICHCPVIEYLSLTSCSFDEFESVEIFSSSLKTLLITYSKVKKLRIRNVINLESFTFLSSEFEDTDGVTFAKSYKLKRVCIRAHHLKALRLHGCHEKVKAVLRTPNLIFLHTDGYLKSKFFVEAPNMHLVEIMFWDIWSGEVPTTLNGHCKRFIAVRNFLQQFSCTRNLTIYIRDENALIFPEKLSRSAFPSPILPNLNTVELVMSIPPLNVRDIDMHVHQLMDGPPPQTTQETENSDLSKSLFWFATSPTKITIEKYEQLLAPNFN